MSRSKKEYKIKKEKDSTLSYTTDDIPLVPLRRNGEFKLIFFIK